MTSLEAAKIFFSAGGVILCISIIAWIRFRNIDRAKARKHDAEAAQITSGTYSAGWQAFVTSMKMVHEEDKNFLKGLMDEQRKKFEKMLFNERMECDLRIEKLEDQY